MLFEVVYGIGVLSLRLVELECRCLRSPFYIVRPTSSVFLNEFGWNFWVGDVFIKEKPWKSLVLETLNFWKENFYGVFYEKHPRVNLLKYPN